MSKDTTANSSEARERYYRQNYKFLTKAKSKGGLLGNGILLKIVLFPVSIVMFIIGLFKGRTISAQEFDKRVAAKSAEAKQRVFGVVGVDQSQVKECRPIIADGIRYGNGVIYDRDSKGTLRASQYSVSIYLFSATEIYVYTYEFSMTEDWQCETTNEYFYKDIVSVEVVNEKFSVKIGAKTKANVKNTLDAGESITISFSSFGLVTTSGKTVSSSFWGDQTLGSINAMKQLIREKKV